jgi:hypothetical protein
MTLFLVGVLLLLPKTQFQPIPATWAMMISLGAFRRRPISVFYLFVTAIVATMVRAGFHK